MVVITQPQLRGLCIISILLILVLNFYYGGYNQLVLLQYSHWDRNNQLAPHQKIVIIYAFHSFHEEVNSAVACLLHEIGFDVYVHIGNGVVVQGMLVPFTGNRFRNSYAYYGKCVKKFLTIGVDDSWNLRGNYDSKIDYGMKSVRLVVFTTYAMMIKEKYDENALLLLQQVQRSNKNIPVVFITHRSYEIFHPMRALVTKYLSSSQTFFMFLSQHTYEKSLGLLALNRTSDSVRPSSMNYFYPVLPLHYIIGTSAVHKISTELLHDSHDRVTFAVQGNFGGRHAHRKDLYGVSECLFDIETEIETNRTLQLQLQPKVSLNTDLIGNVFGKVHIKPLQHSTIRFRSGLPSSEFYEAIAHAKFMIAAINDVSYITDRATSSVPAAMIASIPLVMSHALFVLYPCLRDLPIHQLINAHNHSECQSMHTAVQLQPHQYKQAREEITFCASQFWEVGKRKFSQLTSPHRLIDEEE